MTYLGFEAKTASKSSMSYVGFEPTTPTTAGRSLRSVPLQHQLSALLTAVEGGREETTRRIFPRIMVLGGIQI